MAPTKLAPYLAAVASGSQRALLAGSCALQLLRAQRLPDDTEPAGDAVEERLRIGLQVVEEPTYS